MAKNGFFTTSEYFTQIKEGSDLSDVVSVLNNVWSSLNSSNGNTESDQDDARRSLHLAVADVASVILEPFKKANIVSDGYKMYEYYQRFQKNMGILTAQTNKSSPSYTGYVKITTISDIFVDGMAMLSESIGIVASAMKISPWGVALEVLSKVLDITTKTINAPLLAITQAGNIVNLNPKISEHVRWNAETGEPEIHVDYIDELLSNAIQEAIEQFPNMVMDLSELLLSYVPDGLNPLVGESVTLMGDSQANVLDAEEAKDLFTSYVRLTAWAGAGNDTLRGSTFDDYLDGGADDDKLYGGAGQDVLLGGSGHDLLDGGESKDQLYGGDGVDIYIAQNHDVIVDSDGRGSIFLQTGKGLVYAEHFVQDKFDDPNMWFSVDSHGLRDGKLVAQRDDAGNLTVFLGNFDDSVLIEDFFATATQVDNTYRGLGLTLAQDDGSSHALPTDFHADNQDPARYSTIYVNDAAKSYTVNGGVLDDLIMVNNAQFVQVLAGIGNDRVFGSLNADRIYGGDGNDVLNGSRFISSNNSGLSAEQLALDADTIIGNSGRDIINGFAGDDVIFTEERNSYLSEINTNQGGDWATGGLGNDKIFGSSNRDFLLGGEGGDTIHGGASDDVIIGDGFVRASQKTQAINGTSASLDWNYNPIGIVAPIPVFQPGQPVGNEYQYNAGKGETAQKSPLYTFNALHQDTWNWSADINKETEDYAIHYSGSTLNFSNDEHRVITGGGSDFLYGGAGDDLVIGQDGNDYVNGGSGDDILFGDDNRDNTLLGNDTLVAGSGSDKLYGGKGFDIYQFDSQDLLQGDMNTIADSDNQGAVMLDGIALGDLGWQATNTAGFWTNENKGLNLHLQNNSLLISGDKFAGKIFIQDFVNGALGINLIATNHDNDHTSGKKEKLNVIVTGEGSGAFETESGSGALEAGSYHYDDGGMGYWTQWGTNSGAFGD